MSTPEQPTSPADLANDPPSGVRLPEALENLSADYKGVVAVRYGQWEAAIEGHIESGRLSPDYRLPEIDVFADRIIALARTYESFRDKGWQPDLGFAPPLPLTQWRPLFGAHQHADGDRYDTERPGTSGGSFDMTKVTLDPSYRKGALPEQYVDTMPAQKTAPEASEWDVFVISNTEVPPLTRVDASGWMHGSDVDVVGILDKLPNAPHAVDSSKLVKRFSPSIRTYLAQQLSRLDQGQQPFDSIPPEGATRFPWTILKPSMLAQNRSMTLTGSVDHHIIDIGLSRYDDSSAAGGVRPAVEGNEAILVE